VDVVLLYSDGSVNEKQDVHKPAVNLAEVKKTAQLREKMDILREKRRVQEKLRYAVIVSVESFNCCLEET
jgi:hypothetical protein